MPNLSNDDLTLAVVVLAAVALLAILSVLALALRIRKLRREYAVLRGEAGAEDVIAAMARSMRRIDGLEDSLAHVSRAQEQQAATGRFALQRVGVVRYDAFDDMGGRLSFSAALLNDHGDGVVITTINGRTEARTYAKPIANLASEHNLSDEEREAIARAVSTDRRAARAPVSK